jgi:membrane protein implicated in regulation of membrane protease activity
MEVFPGIALIICALALKKWVEGRNKKGSVGRQQAEQLEERMAVLERRLGDIQEIVLSIDEKLERQERSSSGVSR